VEQTVDRSELKNPGYELFIGALSVLSIVNLVLLYAINDDDLDRVLLVINLVLSTVFVLDFIFRLATAESKSNYFWRQYGWADLLASLPVQQLKVLRLFRLLRVVRLLRDVGPHNIAGSLLRNRAGSALLTLLLMGILVLQFGSLWMLRLEQDAEGANIASASDALWYVIVTISTVGYGDRFPVTTEGRVLGACIIVIGVGIFGTFTGYLANLFLSPKAAPPEPAGARATIEQLRGLLAQQQAAIDELEAALPAREAPP
jgi:voltage-gated potassium channel Kch